MFFATILTIVFDFHSLAFVSKLSEIIFKL